MVHATCVSLYLFQHFQHFKEKLLLTPYIVSTTYYNIYKINIAISCNTSPYCTHTHLLMGHIINHRVVCVLVLTQYIIYINGFVYNKSFTWNALGMNGWDVIMFHFLLSIGNHICPSLLGNHVFDRESCGWPIVG
jgi:hypothetical protein